MYHVFVNGWVTDVTKSTKIVGAVCFDPYRWIYTLLTVVFLLGYIVGWNGWLELCGKLVQSQRDDRYYSLEFIHFVHPSGSRWS